jgi:peptidoglycan/LPS O-acetylase OafA/YrhL
MNRQTSRYDSENSEAPFLKSNSPRSHGLDTLRALAIFAVIAFHVSSYHGVTVPDAVRPAARMGWIGVDLFFVLSGYLIGSQLLRPYLDGKRPSVWGFYRNRLFRILPAYSVVLALYFAVPAWSEDSLAPLWKYCTFTFNLFVASNFRGFSHVWSLCVEEHFYLVLPLIVLGMMRRPSMRRTVALLAGLVLLGMAIRSFVLLHELRPLARTGEEFITQYMGHIYYPTYSHFDGLLAGVALTLVKMFRPVWWGATARR